MTSSYEDTVFNFDLDLLHHQTTHQTPKCLDENSIDKEHKAHKAILFLKQNAISNDTLMRQCYQVKDMLHQKEKALFVMKQGYQEACIQYKNALDKCSKLETDTKILQIQNQEIKERYDHLENQNGALKSHIRQLEAFVKEQDLNKESSKSERLTNKANVKNEINISIQKQNNLLIQDLCTLGKILKKEKLKKKYKTLLKKYEKYFKCDNNNEDSDEHDRDGSHIFEDTLMSPSSIEDISDDKIPRFSVEIPGEIVVNLNTTRKTCDAKYGQDDNDRFSDCSNEITSADTGRGSSLAFSDNEKCFHSPEYLSNDNQVSSEIRSKTIRSRVDVATSTYNNCERSDVATSPIHFDMHTIPTITIDRATPLTADVSTSPINFEINDVSPTFGKNRNSKEFALATSSVTFGSTERETIDTVQGRHLEKECLEVNSSNNFENECSSDCEIEKILSSMTFNNRLVTPLPKTPSESSEPEISRVSVSCQTDTQPKCRCESIDVFHKELIARINDFHPPVTQEKNQVLEFPSNAKPNKLNITKHKNTANNVETLQPTVIEKSSMLTNTTIINVENEEISLNACENNSSELEVDLDHEIDNELCNTNRKTPTSKISTIIPVEDEEETMFISFDGEETEQNSSVRSRLLFEPSVDTDCEDNLSNSHSLELVHEQHDNPSERLFVNIRPKRQLTKLDKFRKKMVPKSKIKKDIKIPMKKHRTRLKQMMLNKNKLIKRNSATVLKKMKKVTANDSSASLNDRTVYENAVRVMAELNSNANEVKKQNKCFKRKKQQSNKFENQKTRFDVTSNLITTRSRSKCTETSHIVELPNQVEITNEEVKRISSLQDKKRLKRTISNEHEEVQCKRILRSATRLSFNDNNKISKPSNNQMTTETSASTDKEKGIITPKNQTLDTKNKSEHNNTFIDTNVLDYGKSDTVDQETNIIPPKKLSEDVKNKPEHNIISYNTETSTSTDKEKIITAPKEQTLVKKNKSEYNNSSNTFNDTNVLDDGKSVNCHQETNSIPSKEVSQNVQKKSEHNIISYNDMDLFTETVSETQKPSEIETHSTEHPKDSILCHMIEKYHTVIRPPKKIPDSVTDSVCKAIDDNVRKIIELPPEECKNGMDNFVELIRNWNINNFLAGFMKYLQDPQRKLELFSKVNTPPAPPMTKSEKILLYVVTHLKQAWPSIDIVNYILKHIEHILFKINRTPEFDTIESLAHFYALTCRYFDMRTRLRIFVLNAMYCIQFKAIALIKQTLDVWMHVLPLGHMGTAKSPLVLCIVYLLHFYKCEDFYQRVQGIRTLLQQKYSYKMSEWNETKILDMFKNAIRDIKVPNDKKVVRLALLVLAKRQGPRWCQKNIITNMLLPMIEKENERIKHFCVSLLGPLMKPYPVDMKVHCEIVINQLLDMANQNPSHKMKEAIYTSLIYISKHNQNRVIRALLDWHPKEVSVECENILCDFVREKPAHIWDRVLSKISLNNTSNLV